jgi:hypothetical protein
VLENVGLHYSFVFLTLQVDGLECSWSFLFVFYRTKIQHCNNNRHCSTNLTMRKASIYILCNVTLQSCFCFDKFLKRRPQGLLRDHRFRKYLPVARMQPAVLLELNWSLSTQAGPLWKRLVLWFSLPICSAEESVSRQRVSKTWEQHSRRGWMKILLILYYKYTTYGFTMQAGGTLVLVR